MHPMRGLLPSMVPANNFVFMISPSPWSIWRTKNVFKRS